MRRFLIALLIVPLAFSKAKTPVKVIHIGQVGSVPGNNPPLVRCTGVCVSFSSQGEAAINALTGKKLSNFQAIEAITCSDRIASFPSGLILQMANSIGIQTIQGSVGTAIVRQQVSVNWRSIVINTAKYGSIIALSFFSSGLAQVGRAAMLATVISHEAADDLPNLISPGAPNPDPFLSNIINSTTTLGVSPTNCQDGLFPGVYEGPGTSFVTNPIQLIP